MLFFNFVSLFFFNIFGRYFFLLFCLACGNVFCIGFTWIVLTRSVGSFHPTKPMEERYTIKENLFFFLIVQDNERKKNSQKKSAIYFSREFIPLNRDNISIRRSTPDLKNLKHQKTVTTFSHPRSFKEISL